MKRTWIHWIRQLSLTAGLIAACAAGAAEPVRWYVNASAAAGTRDGRSWQTAFDSLQNALTQAGAGDEIWVARGTYYPDPADRTVSFQLKADVAVYGGFAGTETALDQRDWTQHPTILSGAIGNGDKTKNTVTIVKGADRAILDGFTVSGAYSIGEARMHLLPSDIEKNDMAVGGGMRNFKVSPVVRNCIFKDNTSPKGGAVYNVQDASVAVQAQFINVLFSGNTAQMRGGGVSNDLGAMPQFINCRFLDNVSQDKGGAVYNDFAASPILLNCLIRGNRAVSAAAIGDDGGSSPLLVHVTIAGNLASSGLGDGLYQGTGADNDPIVINSSVDDVYNWHEDIVAVLHSEAPVALTIPLADFIPISNLAGVLDPAELAAWSDTSCGYQEKLDGATLKDNALIKKLLEIYAKNNGAINYCGAYTRPAVAAATARDIIYVVPESAAEVKDGSSWANALTDLQQAIDLASAGKGSVWIKSGTYAPAAEEKGRIAAFTLYDGVKLYGGFAGTESAVTERAADAAPTILSAKTKDGGFRYCHVVYGADDAVLDGLTIRDGKADGFTYNGKGGGLLAYHAGETYKPLGNYASTGFTMRIANCRFEDNQAIEGGAIYAFSKAKLTISNTVFADNQAVYGGAVLSREGNGFTYDNCEFRSNRAARDGGATYEDYGAHATYTACTFAGNSAKRYGGAIYVISRASQLEATVVDIDRCSFERNRAPEGDTVFNLDTSVVNISRSNLDLSAASADFRPVADGVKYRRIGEYSVERLNRILTGERAAFSNFAITYPAAENAVTLYKVVYTTVVPEDNNRPVEVSGLIAVPQVSATRLPMLSYQHGTVFSRDEVPSDIEKSAETRLVLARFAGQGYIVIAPDYVGKGVSGEPDGWLVKEVSAQACVDMLSAARAVCRDLGLAPSDLFLSGWSQGSFSTSAFLQRLESNGIPVTAAAEASAPNDIYLCVNRWIHVPSPLDVNWLAGAAVLLVNSYENYYKLPGLTAAAFKPQYLETARAFYANRITWEEAEKVLPFAVKDLFREDFLAPGATASTAFFKQLQMNSSYHWRFQTPVIYYYGAVDEVVTPYMVQLPVEYQRTLGAVSPEAVYAGDKADHRGTFLFSLLDQKERFDRMCSSSGGKSSGAQNPIGEIVDDIL